MTRINIEMDNELHKKAKIAALMQDISLQDFVNKALEEKVKKEEKKTKNEK